MALAGSFACLGHALVSVLNDNVLQQQFLLRHLEDPLLHRSPGNEPVNHHLWVWVWVHSDVWTHGYGQHKGMGTSKWIQIWII